MKMETYEQMLEELYSALPEKKAADERFEMPKVDCVTEGNKTIVKNYAVILQTIRREEETVSKYLTREIAAPVKKEGDRLVIQRKINRDFLQKKVENFITDYVLCTECKKPDTNIAVISGIKMLVCEACGARRPLK